MTANNTEDIYWLTPIQETFFLQDTDKAENETDSRQLSFRIEGELDAERLEQAWQRVVRRHSVLRTMFLWKRVEEPLQVVQNQVAASLEKRDFSSASDSDEQLQMLLREERDKGFDLSKAPLLRVVICRNSDASHQFVLSYHPLVIDEQGLAVVVRELFAEYTGERANGHGSAPTFGQYVAWLREEEDDTVRDYWRALLSGVTLPTSFGVDRISTVYPEPEAARSQRRSLPASTTARLRATVEEKGLTLEAIVAGVWALLLSRYSREDDVVFGFNVARPSAGMQRAGLVVGPLSNTLPVRVRVDREDSLLPLLESLQAQLANLDRYSYTSPVQIRKWNELPQHAPLFESALAFGDEPLTASALSLNGTLRVNDVRFHGESNAPLSLRVQSGTELGIQINYETGRFHTETITRLAAHLCNLLEAVAANPMQRLSEISMLGEAERRSLLDEWNETATDYPRSTCVHKLFEAQAALTPDAIAAVYDDGQLTYAELNRRANQLAHHLMRLGVGPETPVGVCLERSVEMVVALLGILKAGGAYLPLDTSYPIERLSFMIEDSSLPVLVTQENLVDTLPALPGFFVCVDDVAEAAIIRAESDQNPGHELSADNLAYIIYTSGSTGMPKGISITHRGVVRLVCDTNYIRIRPDDRIAQASNASFDAATFELWGALLHGATIIGISKDVSLSPRTFANRLRDQEVTILFLTTALFNQMVIESPVCFAGLRYLLFGGEAVEPKWVRQVLKQGAPEHILHVYGPTESTTYATYHNFSEIHEEAKTIPIGIPLANTTVYLLDKNLDVVPVGVPGELFVGGDGLARDYLKRPELTAEKFIPNPFGRAGERLYRTGDLACYMPDGSIVFIGRADYQVKVRGYRIELEEIEAVLSGYPSVKAVIVQAWEEPGDRRLVAYLVWDGEDTPTAAELRSYLSVKLPDYMIPAAFIKMESLPLTANGKVDRRALPAPDSISMDEAPFVAPRTLTEELIAAAWSDLLRLPHVSRNDSFFELGGHSLLATQLISRLRDLFSVELTLRTVFDSPVLADLAAAVDLARFGSAAASAVPFERVERDGPLPLSFAQQRLWFLDQLEPGTALYNVPAAVRLRGHLDQEALQRTLTEVVRRHESLRTTFTVEGGEPRQMIAEPAEFSLKLIDFSAMTAEAAEQEALQVVAEEAVRPFDLAAGPLLRVTLIRVSETEHIAVLVMHHIISDGWSMGLLISEVTRLYTAYAGGAAVEPEELEWQYADYAAWQRRRLSGAALEEELSYWRQQLAGAPAVLELATDRPRPAVPSYRGANEVVELSAELTEGLRELSRKSGVTLFMTLLAGFQTLLWRYSGQRVVNVGTPVANRTRAEAEGIIGFFVNTLVLRGELEGGMRVGELLRQVRETCLGAYGHQEVPFERVVEELQPERSLSHTPLFQVMFILQNTPADTFKLPDVELSMLDIVNKISNFDLTFSLTEVSDTLALVIEYSTDLFDAETIHRMAEHYQHLLAGMVADDAAQLSQLPMLSEPERRLLLEWNDTRAPYSSDKCVHQLFEAVAARQPEVVAVSHADDQMCYGELNARANRLAHYLIARGVGPDVLVGLMVERSIAEIVGLLAVLKAGGAYVPLDTNYPDERLTYMLEDSGARLLLTEKRFIENFSVPHHCEVVCLDTDWEAIARKSTANPERWLSPDHLAYVMYTSGSTGKPKGVMIAHHSLINYIEAIISDLCVGPTDRVLQFASLSFDASAEEIYTCLLSGATLVLRTDEMLETPATFLRECGKRRLTVLDIAVPYWRELTADPSMAAWEDAPDVRLLITGAEKPQPERLARWFERVGDRIRLVNTYGPTEATIVATLGDLKPQERRRDGTLPEATIGRAAQNIQAFVLDKNLQLLPIGAAGELHIGGEGLARGYLDRAELTAEKFIPNPFSDTPGARLYKTGDLAKYLPDGNLEFLGRVDHQVKLRGFRIEPGEVEVVLSQYEDVEDSVVIIREDTPGDKRLVAYYTTKGGAAPKSNDLRNYLQDRLPDYMIPSFFVSLDRLPLTTSDKVDRRALPAPDLSMSELADEYVAPRTPTEETLADIWGNVLGLERVGVFDNFFQLGGHSLLITQILSRVREAFYVEVSLKVFFNGTPTVARLAEFVEEANFAQANDEEIDELLADLDALSDEAVRELLARERSSALGI